MSKEAYEGTKLALIKRAKGLVEKINKHVDMFPAEDEANDNALSLLAASMSVTLAIIEKDAE